MRGHKWIRKHGQACGAIDGRIYPALGVCSCGEPDKSFRVAAARIDYDDTGGTRLFTPGLFGAHLKRPRVPVFALGGGPV